MIRKLLFFILYNCGLPYILRKKMLSEKELSVLLFHRISNSSDKLWPAMPIKSFKKLILKLHQTVYIGSFSELAHLTNYPSKPLIILSFDDGYSDFYENVIPFFQVHEIKANHNICPGLIELSTLPWTQMLSLYLSFRTSDNEVLNSKLEINNNNKIDEKMFIELCKKLLKYEDAERNEIILPLLNHIPKDKLYTLMNWEQIKYCVHHNIEIGSHGNMHRNLLQVFDIKILENEIKDSSKKIEIETGKKPAIFAFANAMGNTESKAFVRNSGYQFSLISMDKLFKWHPLSEDEKLEIPRINISRADWREEYLRALGFHCRIKEFLK